MRTAVAARSSLTEPERLPLRERRSLASNRRATSLTTPAGSLKREQSGGPRYPAPGRRRVANLNRRGRERLRFRTRPPFDGGESFEVLQPTLENRLHHAELIGVCGALAGKLGINVVHESKHGPCGSPNQLGRISQ